MSEVKAKPTEKQQVVQVIEDLFNALCGKDIKGMMAHYASDVVVFDVKPPFQTKGAVAWRHIWEACLPYFPEGFNVETRDMVVHVSGDLAIAHYMLRLVCDDKDHPASQTWIRTTSGFKRQQGRWK